MKCVELIRGGLREALREDGRVILLGEDICDPYGGAFKATKGLSEEFPGRLINIPISEGAVTGVATGMALGGLRPVLEIMFADFLTLCCDQIINHASKFKWMYNRQVTVPMVIRTPVGGYRGYGPTHSQSPERILFGFPDIKILALSRFHQIKSLIKAAIKNQDLSIVIENKSLYSEEAVSAGDGYYQDFKIWREHEDGFESVVLSSCPLDEMPAITLVTYGGIASMVFAAARKALLEEEVTCEIIIPALIKPIDLKVIRAAANRSRKLLIVEEGHLSWGWGTELLAGLYCSRSEQPHIRCGRIGAADTVIPCSKKLEERILPSQDQIFEGIVRLAEA